jgi:hypothetical protein
MRAAAVVVLVLAAVGCGGDESKPVISPSKTAVVRGEITPSVHLFAEPVVARVDVIVNREKVDPDDVELKTDFEPYEPVGETEVERRDLGNFTVIRYTTTLNCLNERCIPPPAGGEPVEQVPGLPPSLSGQQREEKIKFEFPPALLVADAEPKDKTLGRVLWAPLRSLSRINWYDSSVVGQGFPFETSVTPLPEPRYRISPTLLGIAMVALAVALLALPIWLVWDRRRRTRGPVATKPRLSPLERALRLVEWASRRPSIDERREALEALAFELGHEDDGDLAKRAREQGWSPPPPESDEMNELVTSIRANDASPS